MIRYQILIQICIIKIQIILNGRIEKENCWISQGLNFTAACDALKTVIGTDDVEPDQNNRVKDISAFPKRLRFYHAIIDSRSLKSGEDFGKLNHPYAEGYNAVWTN